MKNMFFILSLFLFSISIINGQNVSFGVQGGVSHSKLINKGNGFFDLGTEYKTGFNVGINTTIDLGNWAAVRAGFNVQREGGKDGITLTDVNGNTIDERGHIYLHFDYLSLPLMMQFSFGKNIKLLAHIGTEFKYLAKQVFVFDSQVINGRRIKTVEENTSLFNRYDQSGFVGLGLSFPMKNNLKIIVLTRSAIGLNEISNAMNGNKLKHLSFAATAGVQYYLHKKEKG